MAGHKHAALMAEYAKDAAETEWPWKRWQVNCDAWTAHGNGTWCDLVVAPGWDPEVGYRRKPRMLTIAGREIEAPLQNAQHGSYAYATYATGEVFKVRACFVDREFEEAFVNGRLFATPEAAEAAYDAITALLTGKDAA